MTALNDAAPAYREETGEPAAEHHVPDETGVLGEIHDLMLEALRLAHAGDALETNFPVNLRPGHRPG